jgi:hypothetical protein
MIVTIDKQGKIAVPSKIEIQELENGDIYCFVK